MQGGLLFEQIIEGLPRARRTRGAGLALDGCPGREECAGVQLILWRHPRRERGLRALPSGARVERHTVDAAVQVHTAPWAPAVGPDRHGKPVTAPRSAEHLVRGHQIRRARTGGVLQRTSGRSRFLGRLLVPRLAIARFVLVAALPVLPVAHEQTPFYDAWDDTLAV